MKIALALIFALAFAEAPAHADSAGINLKLDTQYERTKSPETIRGLRDLQVTGLSLEVNAGVHDRIGLSAFIDGHFGAGAQGGFAYRFALLPLGLTLHDKGQVVSLALAGGLQLHGVTQHQPFGVQAPVRASLVLNLGGHLQLATWATNEFALGKKRRDGSPNALFGDEMRAGLSLRLGSSGSTGGRKSKGGGRYGSGYFLSILYAERFGSEFWGLGIGHGMNMQGSD